MRALICVVFAAALGSGKNGKTGRRRKLNDKEEIKRRELGNNRRMHACSRPRVPLIISKDDCHVDEENSLDGETSK